MGELPTNYDPENNPFERAIFLIPAMLAVIWFFGWLSQQF